MSYREELPTTIKECLLFAYNSDELKKMARLLEVSPLPMRKEDLINGILPHLQGEALKKLWGRLSKLQQAAVAEAVGNFEGKLEQRMFAAKYGNLPERGLLDLLLPHERIPDDLQQRLKAFVPEPAPPNFAGVSELPPHVVRTSKAYDAKTRLTEVNKQQVELVRCDTERVAADELHAVLRLIDTGKVSVSDKTRMPSAASCRAIAAVLTNGDFYPEVAQNPAIAAKRDPVTMNEDGWETVVCAGAAETPGPIKAFAWPMLIQAAGWAQLRGSRLELTKAGRTALLAPIHEALRTAWLKWLDSKLLDELRRIECIRGQTGSGKRGLTAPVERRAAIHAALQDCTPGQWFSLDDFSRFMRAAGHEFQVTRNAWDLYICEKQYGSLGYKGCGGWNILQFRYMLCLLFEYAATLGLLDVAYISPVRARPDFHDIWGTDDLFFFSRYDGLWYFRVNNLGAYCLDRAEAYVAPPLEKRHVLKLSPNFDIVTDGGKLAASDRLLLDKYAERTNDGVWRLEPEKVLVALDAGGTIEELRSFLLAAGGEPLPEPPARFFEELERRSKLLRNAGVAWLIECADAGTATLIANDSSAGRCCRLAGDNTLAVPAASVRAFAKAVRKMGYPLTVPADFPLTGGGRSGGA
jgi:hypothetical protein